MERRLASLLFAGLLALAGCGVGSSSSVRPAPESGPVPVELTVIQSAQWDAALKAQRGKLVVVDTWATWCGPCVEEFPELVQLHQRHAKDRVACVSVSLDDPKDRDKALAFLKDKGAAFPNYLADNKDWWLDRWNIGGIPVVLVFDREGKLVRKFDRDDPDKQFTYADVEQFVGEMLAAKR
jgi:thiol-disulfide isomerase/thioredoxin